MSGSLKPSYSQILRSIRSGEVESLILDPSRREVLVKYKNGEKLIAPTLRNDQEILRSSSTSNTPLTVKDFRQEQAVAGLAGNLALISLIIVGLTFIAKRSLSSASRTMGFMKSNHRIQGDENIIVTFDDVAGINEASDELEEVVDFLKKPEKLNELGGIIPKGILLVGPPGTGKTLLAKAIAGEANVPFFSISASEFVELFVGVGASRVRDLFIKAKEKSPCIIFIDEIDSIGRQRGAGIGGGNDEREQTLNQLLTEMDGFTDNQGIIVLAATNRADILDGALTRPGRFDRKIYIDLPDRKGRKDILSIHARTKPLNNSVSLNDWAIRTPGFSGADLANLLNEAAIITARQNMSTLGDNQIEDALERITIGISKSNLQDSTKKILIAYHEVGHALVAAFTPNADVVDKITILPRTGGVGGFTRFFPNEEILDSGLYSKSYLYSKIVVSLGGRAAEQVVFGTQEVTQGASSDIENVAFLARQMVTQFGFSALGPLSIESDTRDVFLGRDLINNKKLVSQKTKISVDKEVRIIAFKALNQAIQILESKRDIMDELVNLLLEEETINSKRFNSIAFRK